MTHLDLSISPIAQAKKRRRSPLRLRFLACTLEEISCAICITYFPTVPKELRKRKLAAYVYFHCGAKGYPAFPSVSIYYEGFITVPKAERKNMIYLENVTKIYENMEKAALRQVNLQVERGEFLFVTGESGSGKSTLIRLLIREICATEGKILVNGRNLSEMDRKQVPIYRRNLGIVFQDMRLLEDRTVFENLSFAREALYGYQKDTSRRVASMLAFLELGRLSSRYPVQLSGGEKQKAAIARAMMNDPAFLFADEPTGNLDAQASREIMDLFGRIHKKGTTVVVATHDIGQAKRLGHRRIVLSEGKIQ